MKCILSNNNKRVNLKAHAQRIFALTGLLFVLFFLNATCYASDNTLNDNTLNDNTLDPSYNKASYEEFYGKKEQEKVGFFERIKMILVAIVELAIAFLVLKFVVLKLPSFTAKGIGCFLWLIFVTSVISTALGVNIKLF